MRVLSGKGKPIVMALCLSSALTAVPALAHGTGEHAHDMPKVVASIKPVHSLVASVMDGVGTPVLLMEGAGSPHTASLRPSQAAELQEANIVFWVGDQMETFLTGPIETIAADATSVELMNAPGLELLPFREGGAFEAHDHGDHDDAHGHGDMAHGADDHAHDHEHSADAAHDHDHDHGHAADAGHDHDHGHTADVAHGHDDDHAAHDHDHDHGHAADAGHDHDHDHDHGHGAYDAHVWLDPDNAKAMVEAIAVTLSEADPDHAALYRQNADATIGQIDALEADIAARLAPVADRDFIVFHDAYQYYENRFGITAAGSITISPEVMPGADRLRQIRDRISETNAVCIFAEPQFEPRLVNTVIEGTDARSGVLDPLGAGLAAGPGLYAQLLETMTASLVGCLSQAS